MRSRVVDLGYVAINSMEITRGLFYPPTVLADVPTSAPAFGEEVFGPVASVVRLSTVDEAVQIAAATEHGLSLGIVTRDPLRGLELADRLPTGIVHINDQTVNDEANAPFGGVRASGTGSRLGGAAASIEAFTETRGVTLRSKAATYPFLTSSEMRHAALLSGVRPTRANRSMADNGGVHHRSPPYWSIVCNYLEVKSRVR